MCFVYNAEQPKPREELVHLASVAVESYPRGSYQFSVCRRVVGYPDWDLSGLARLSVVLQVLGVCHDGTRGVYHG